MDKHLSFPVLQWDSSEAYSTKFLKKSPTGLSPIACSNYPHLNASFIVFFSPSFSLFISLGFLKLPIK